jgi:hypothetical protein
MKMKKTKTMTEPNFFGLTINGIERGISSLSAVFSLSSSPPFIPADYFVARVKYLSSQSIVILESVQSFPFNFWSLGIISQIRIRGEFALKVGLHYIHHHRIFGLIALWSSWYCLGQGSAITFTWIETSNTIVATTGTNAESNKLRTLTSTVNAVQHRLEKNRFRDLNKMFSLASKVMRRLKWEGQEEEPTEIQANFPHSWPNKDKDKSQRQKSI